MKETMKSTAFVLLGFVFGAGLVLVWPMPLKQAALTTTPGAVGYNCKLSGGTFEGGRCSCPTELGQTQDQMYDQTTGFCQTTAGGPAGNAFAASVGLPYGDYASWSTFIENLCTQSGGSMTGAVCTCPSDVPYDKGTGACHSATVAATVLVSPDVTTKYCDGAAMDSAGYRKTITVEKSITLPPNQTEAEHVKSMIVAGTTGMCTQVLQQSKITVVNGEVRIPSIDGWAGISIEMCSCVPQVEVNALRIPGIKKVVWNAAP